MSEGNRTFEGNRTSESELRDRETEAAENASRSIEKREGVADRWTKRVWASGSYEEIAPNYVSMGGHLVERIDVDVDETVLDVGCGTGTVAITAARRGAQVTGVDIQPAMLDHARRNAEIAGVDVSWREADVTALPFEGNTFDATLSNLGHMYGDPPDTTTRELLRVTRPGGRIGFTSWTPTSLYPSMAGVVMTVLSPEHLPEFSEPPFLWGDPDTVDARLGDAVADLTFETETVQYPALSPEHFWRHTATNSGIFTRILESVDDDDRSALRERSIETIEPYFDPRENAVELEYRLTSATVTDSTT